MASDCTDCNSQTSVTHLAAKAALARVYMEVGLDYLLPWWVTGLRITVRAVSHLGDRAPAEEPLRTGLVYTVLLLWFAAIGLGGQKTNRK